MCRECLAKMLANFNSHAHVERDQGEYIIDWIVTISTHTLTWSVTVVMLDAIGRCEHFNSHAHVERD